MNYAAKLRSNIRKNYLFILTKALDLTHGVWMIYLAMKGMSLYQLGLLEGIFHVTSFTMEVPTGLVADVYGRKVSRICGRFASLIGIIILMFANSFYLFALSFIFMAISYNLESGAGEALIYDSLKEISEEEGYMKVAGTGEMVMQCGSVLSLAIGGYLASISYFYTFLATAFIILITIIQAFSFTEPNIEFEHTKEKNIFKILKKQVSESLRVLKSKKKLGFLIVFSQMIFVFGTCLFYYLQNYLKISGYNESKIGIMLAASSLIGAAVASQAYRIEKVLKEKGILLIMPLVTIGCIWGIALTKYHYLFYILMMAVDGVIFVAISDYMNKLIPSQNRATILSFASMVFSFFMIFIFPLIGKIGDMYSLQTAFVLLAGVGSILVVVNVWFLVRDK
ncbi:MFS transporter [Wukongibacter baidiensis]|uniref:MFS transporter n=1 Tax=Wukongibacter baidiensis TaxID=1723361 RepID=UPI003D7FC7E0